MKLIFLRHAKAAWSDPMEEDHDRPLDPQGQSNAPRIGAWLTARGHLPTLTLCSTARRTRETLTALALPKHEVRFHDDLYLAEVGRILALANAQRTACLLMIGHNPGIADAAARSCVAPPAHRKFATYPTAACTVIDATDGLPGAVLDFTVPRDLG